MKQKILVAVTGMTPQIVTETVYALHKNHNWLPEKIIVLTTLSGKKQIVAQLLGEKGYFNRLREDYRLPEIEFSAETIKVIAENGAELDDIRTAEQNNAAADLIVQTIYDLCQDDNTELHVSIAGGRKSMGFYVGYALSLFGRVQDKMSHVLVEEAFEQNREFFYPPVESQILNTERYGMKDAKDAQIMLADIPFVRMTQNQLQFVFDKNMTFSQAVAHTQTILSGGMKVVFNVATCEVKIGDATKFKLPEAQFSVYAAMAKRTKEEKMTDFSQTGSLDFAKDFVHFYQYHQDGMRGNSTAATQMREEKIEDLQKDNQSGNIKGTVMKRIFMESRSPINNTILPKHLGEYGSRFEIKDAGNNNAKTYFLTIDPHLIEIIE